MSNALIFCYTQPLERVHHCFVAAEQVLYPVAVAGEGRWTVELVHGSIERGVGLAQVGGHGVGVVEVCQAGRGVRGASLEHRVSEAFNPCPLGQRGAGPRKGVVD